MTVFVGEWALYLDVNGQTVEGINISNDCAFNRSQKRCFYYVLLQS